MLKMIKSLRQPSNAKLLIVSSHAELQNEMSEYFKECKLVNSSANIISELEGNRFDLIILDTKVDDMSFVEVCALLHKYAASIPKIVVSDDDNEENIKAAVNFSAYAFLSRPLNLKDLTLSTIMCLNQTKRGDKYEFAEGFYYDNYRELFFDKYGKKIELTKLEYGLLRLLLENGKEITDYDVIQRVVWKGKKMSVFTMRNVVNKIRQKMYYGIIKNHSNKGYTIDSVIYDKK